ncbi:MAG: hypothetical protein HQL38_13375 [Alphaproteobacteria bacterium]|nr:hypothetical protein [Alphaproteobacteria bacterium]
MTGLTLIARLRDSSRRLAEVARSGDPSQAVLVGGAVLVAAVVVLALLPDRAPTVISSDAASAMTATAVPAALPGLTPFVPTAPIQFAGRVTRTVSVGDAAGWGQVHLWINDGTGSLLEISVAPQSYLRQIGCPTLDNARLTGTGFLFDPTRPGAEIYAKDVVVNGVTCRLRDDEGLALWFNPTQ